MEKSSKLIIRCELLSLDKLYFNAFILLDFFYFLIEAFNIGHEGIILRSLKIKIDFPFIIIYLLII